MNKTSRKSIVLRFSEEGVGALWDERYKNRPVLADARGQVCIEGRQKLVLQITALSHGQLGALGDLPPHSLYGIHCGYNPLYITDQNAILSLRWLRMIGLSCVGDADDVFPRMIREFPQLREVHYGGTLLSDFSLRDAPRSETLRRLNPFVGRKEISDRGAENIVLKMPRLFELGLTQTRITNDGLRKIASLSLRILNVGGTDIGDSGVASISNMTSLRNLGLYKTRVSDGGIYFLRNLTHLSTLLLFSTEVGDDAVRYLSNMRSLRMLGLTDTLITKASLPWLSKMTQLQSLMLGDRLDADSLAFLRQKLPNCFIPVPRSP
jgi:hypothetical protein